MQHPLHSTLAILMLFVSPALLAQEECEETLDNIEGPFYREGSPERTSIFIDGNGPMLTITGTVVGHDCNPIPGAWIDFWQADRGGIYDNTSAKYLFRGHQFANDQGEYTFVANVPGLYPGRPKHIHVKAQGELADVKTTQLYFPDDPFNSTDHWYEQSLEVIVTGELPNGDITATFQFQLDEPGVPACIGDLNKDGQVDGADLTQLLGEWMQSNSSADFDGDGMVDGADLTILLGAWGAC